MAELGDLDIVTFDQYVVGPGNPGDGPFPYTFDFEVDAAAIIVRVLEPDSDSYDTKVEGVDYLLDETASRITFIVLTYEPPTDSVVRIERHTSRVRVLDYEAGSTLTAANLNNDNNQEFYILQEMENDLERALFKDLTGSFWEGEGLRSENCAEATTPDGWVTLAQAQAILIGGDVVHIDSADVFTFVGDGVTTDFELDQYNTLTAERCIVSIQGVLQHVGEEGSPYEGDYYSIIHPDATAYPGTAFTWDIIRFVEPPANNDIIEVRIYKGTVLATYGDGVITSDSLEDGILEWRHFEDLNRTPASRVIFNPSGPPTYEAVTDIANFTGSLNTWLATKDVGDFTTFIDRNLNMQSKKITGLANGSATDDAATYGQVLSARVFIEKQDLATVRSSGQSDATFSFAPDFVFVFGQDGINGHPTYGMWFASFLRGDDIEAVAGGIVAASDGPTSGHYVLPVLRIRRLGTGNKTVRVTMQTEGDAAGSAVATGQVIAVKF